MLIDLQAIKEYLKDENNTGYRISKDTGIAVRHSYALKKGEYGVESMNVGTAIKIQKVINDKRTEGWSDGPKLTHQSEGWSDGPKITHQSKPEDD